MDACSDSAFMLSAYCCRNMSVPHYTLSLNASCVIRWLDEFSAV